MGGGDTVQSLMKDNHEESNHTSFLFKMTFSQNLCLPTAVEMNS